MLRPRVPRTRTAKAVAVTAVLVGLLAVPALAAPLLDAVRPDAEPEVTRIIDRLSAEREAGSPDAPEGQTEDPGAAAGGAAAGGAPGEPADDGDNPLAGAPASALPPITFDRDASLQFGRIIMPSVGLDVQFASGVDDLTVQKGPGHWPGTPLPGEPGNAVLSGHRTTFTAPFADLDLLQPGDPITTGVGSLPGVEYRVTETRIVPEAEYVDVVLAQPADPSTRRLTLFACTPKGQRTHRIVVTAEAPPAAAPVPPAQVSTGG